ncbi:extracellular solute-binding protein [Paenibacillus sp. BC26]|uniref:extracellular solute-binding protein n=1 Tax=Paenibacillus sp. BC26 TaxID=1881032 RepID=UPI0008F05F42|nr:extracellular solute-binding protein [Paenibacillus sp. BC26]SFT16000.1 Maltose-binding protein MalE [Paenibacillus sp. BC26]
MKLKKTTALMGTALLMVALTACGGNNNKTVAENEKPSNTATTETNDATNEAANSTENTPAAAEPVTLTVLNEGAVGIGVGLVDDLLVSKEKELKDGGTDIAYTPGSQFEGAAFGLYYQKFISTKLKEKNISVKTEDWGWGEPLIQKETAGFLAKNIPDIIVGETQMPGFAQQGLLEAFPDDMAAEIREKLAPAAWKPMEIDGKIYGLASQPGVSSLFWNKKLVKEAGLDPEKAITTWAELVDNAKKVTDAGKGKFYGGGVYGAPNFGGYLRYGALVAINGGTFADANGLPTFNSDANVEVIELLRTLNANHPAGLMLNNNEGTYFDAWNKGQLAYLIDGPWRAQECKNVGLECGMAPIPLSPNGKPGNVTIGAAFHSVPVDAKNKEAAFDYIRAMYSTEVQQLIADSNTRSPILKEIAETDDYKTKHPEMYLHYQAMIGNVQGLPTFAKDNSKAWQIFGDAAVKSLMTDGDIKAIMDDAQKRAELVTK